MLLNVLSAALAACPRCLVSKTLLPRLHHLIRQSFSQFLLSLAFFLSVFVGSLSLSLVEVECSPLPGLEDRQLLGTMKRIEAKIMS